MKYAEFKNLTRPYPLFSTGQLRTLLKEKGALLNLQLTQWKKKGYISPLRRGLYILNENDRTFTPSRSFLAGQLYNPSYISLEYALSFYSLIPEKVTDLTSISTKKTARFKNIFGTFIYQHIKPIAFSGFHAQKDEHNLPFFLAAPEKALTDYLYLNLSNFKSNDINVFTESLRLQNLEILNIQTLKNFGLLYNNKKLKKVINNLTKVINTQK